MQTRAPPPQQTENACVKFQAAPSLSLRNKRQSFTVPFLHANVVSNQVKGARTLGNLLLYRAHPVCLWKIPRLDMVVLGGNCWKFFSSGHVSISWFAHECNVIPWIQRKQEQYRAGERRWNWWELNGRFCYESFSHPGRTKLHTFSYLLEACSNN